MSLGRCLIVTKVELTVDLELIVLFEGELRLQVSPVPANLGEWNNYSFFDRVSSFTVDEDGRVVWEPRFA
jgi:hypothetical protein